MARIKAKFPVTGGRDDIRQEVERLFDSPQFARAPVMRALLSYLVEQSLAGNGDRLKAYTIAVDALGRAPSFDAQANSYPRVQVGRLRALLADYYAGNPGVGELRIAIPKGGYRVDFEEPLELGDRAPIGPAQFAGDTDGRPRFAPFQIAAGAAGAMIVGLVGWQNLRAEAETAPQSLITVALPAAENSADCAAGSGADDCGETAKRSGR